MKLKDLFTPRFKHSDPNVRISAIKEISSDEILREVILADPDRRVVEEALKLVTSPRFLATVIGEISSSPQLLEQRQATQGSDRKRFPAAFQMMDIIQERYEQLLYKNLLKLKNSSSEFKQLLPLLKNDEKLITLYKELLNSSASKDITKDTSTESAASLDNEITIQHERLILDQIEDEKFIYKFLKDVESSADYADLFEKISAVDLLKKLSSTAHNKKIRKLAQQKLDAGKESLQNLSTAEIRQKLEEIINVLKAHVSEKFWEEGAKKLPSFRDIWGRLDASGKHPLTKEFEALANTISNGAHNYHENISKLNALEQTLKSEGKARRIDRIEILKHINSAYISEGELKSWEDRLNGIASHLTTADHSLASHPTVAEDTGKVKSAEALSPNLKASPEESLNYLSKYLQELKDLKTSYTTHKVSISSAQKRLMTIDQYWSKYFFDSELTKTYSDDFASIKKELEDKFISDEKAAEEKQKQEKLKYQRAHQIYELLDESFKNNDYRNKNIRLLQQEFDAIKDEVSLEKELVKNFHNVISNIYTVIKKQKEDRHWEEWGNYQHRKDLCVEAQKLAEDPLQDFIGEKLSELQARWRDAGRVPTAQFEELNKEFRHQVDQILGICIQKKREIIDRLKEVLAPLLSSDASNSNRPKNLSVDFKELSLKVNPLLEEWKKVGPLPYTFEKNELQTFNELKSTFIKKKDSFFQNREEERGENLKQKLKILAETERLLKDPYEIGIKIEKLKNLQRQWKNIGPIPRSAADNDPWIAFKKLCDDFFNGIQEEKLASSNHKQELLNKLQATLSSMDGSNLSEFEEKEEQLKNLAESWDELLAGPKELDQKFNELLNNFHRQKKDQFEKIKAEQRKKTENKLKIVRQMEQEYATMNWEDSLNKVADLRSNLSSLLSAEAENDLAAVNNEITERMQRVSRILESELKLWNSSFHSSSRSNSTETGAGPTTSEYQCIIDHLAVIIKIVNPNADINQDKLGVSLGEQLNLGLKLRGLIVDKDHLDKTAENARVEIFKLQEKWCKLPPLEKEAGVPAKAQAAGEKACPRDYYWSNYKYFIQLFFRH